MQLSHARVRFLLVHSMLQHFVLILFAFVFVSTWASESVVRELCAELLSQDARSIAHSWSCSSPPFTLCASDKPVGMGVLSCSSNGEVLALNIDGHALKGIFQLRISKIFN